MKKRKKKRLPFRLRSNRRFWASLITAAILLFLQQHGQPINQNHPLPGEETLEGADIASVYDGDTFKINLNVRWRYIVKKFPCARGGLPGNERKNRQRKTFGPAG